MRSSATFGGHFLNTSHSLLYCQAHIILFGAVSGQTISRYSMSHPCCSLPLTQPLIPTTPAPFGWPVHAHTGNLFFSSEQPMILLFLVLHFQAFYPISSTTTSLNPSMFPSDHKPVPTVILSMQNPTKTVYRCSILVDASEIKWEKWLKALRQTASGSAEKVNLLLH